MADSGETVVDDFIRMQQRQQLRSGVDEESVVEWS